MFGRRKCRNPKCKKKLPKDAHWRRKYCSDKCKQRANYTHTPVDHPERECVVCGATFKPVNKRYNRCEECKGKSKWIPVDNPERECANPECRAVFKPVTKRRKFCSCECRYRLKGRPLRRLVCPACGKKFETKHRRKRTCGGKCAKEWDRHALRVRNKEREKDKGLLSPWEWQLTLDQFGHKCVYCGGDWEHKDHYIPLSKGGRGVLGNMVPACAQCNLGKYDTLPRVWLKHRRELREGIEKNLNLLVKYRDEIYDRY